MEAHKDTVEIFEYENSNEYTKRQVYPVVEKAHIVHEGAFKRVPHVRKCGKFIGFDR